MVTCLKKKNEAKNEKMVVGVQGRSGDKQKLKL